MDKVYGVGAYVMISPEGALIDGVTSIVKWDGECIELTARRKRIHIEGKGLRIEYKTMDSILIKGEVLKMEFSQGVP